MCSLRREKIGEAVPPQPHCMLQRHHVTRDRFYTRLHFTVLLWLPACTNQAPTHGADCTPARMQHYRGFSHMQCAHVASTATTGSLHQHCPPGITWGAGKERLPRRCTRRGAIPLFPNMCLKGWVRIRPFLPCLRLLRHLLCPPCSGRPQLLHSRS